ncbi:unnamed protein product [Paramecium sonneborni]|uniref:Uncharacterized protein n=1 Tax=Paramecium sonneborni TaxID=65129 RepID=A0A8S1MDQ3_9CILI|nr:unnamed protein product [Paramecium sonneborni]
MNVQKQIFNIILFVQNVQMDIIQNKFPRNVFQSNRTLMYVMLFTKFYCQRLLEKRKYIEVKNIHQYILKEYQY